ncbi:MAG: D-2-hydroxyacid dehydrogenase [Alphaproteobacteria bacterium]|nr:D-2-hydroxyacid dehydrogenase [Alphaproteobacteria bacterium]
MKIVFLDSHVINPGDIGWGKLEKLGNVSIYDSTHKDDVISRAADADALLIVRSVINQDIIRSMSSLRYVGVFATGVDTVDLNAANDAGVTVTNVPAYSTNSVAQSAMAMMMELTNHVGHHSQGVRAGKWSASEHFCYWDRQITELSGLTLGLIGFGNIAQRVAKFAHAFDMKIVASTRSGIIKDSGVPVELCEINELFKRSDIVSLHCPLTSETKQLVNAEMLALMKPSALLINTARGGLIDEWSLAKALCDGKLGGAALDVMATEPPSKHNPLLYAPNCVITPHNSWSAMQTRESLLNTGIENLRAFIEGNPKNIANDPSPIVLRSGSYPRGFAPHLENTAPAPL